MLISVCWDWALALGLNSVVKLLGGRGASKWCRLVGGIVLAVAVVIAGCGLWFWARARSSSCLAAEVHSKWCRLVGGIVLAVAVTVIVGGLDLVVKLSGGWWGFELLSVNPLGGY